MFNVSLWQERLAKHCKAGRARILGGGLDFATGRLAADKPDA
jgi:hypothetical protein